MSGREEVTARLAEALAPLRGYLETRAITARAQAGSGDREWLDALILLDRADDALAPTVEALVAEAVGACICNTGPGTDGPDECCPQHGRTVKDWIERGDLLADRLAALRQRVEALAVVPRSLDEHDCFKSWCPNCARRDMARDYGKRLVALLSDPATPEERS